jgi:uncharacterized membrane protein
MRNRIAHVFTPWEWRSRWRVLALVAFSTAVGVAALVDVVSKPHYSLASHVVHFAVVAAAIAFGIVRPSLRSLRRWDELHRQTSSSAPA